jgi:transposase
MSTRYVNVDRQTPMLLAPDLRDWVPADDLVHFVIEAVDRLPLKTLHRNVRGTGSAQYPPRMMLALLIYCYAKGVFSSRRIENATHHDVAVRYLTADTHPDHDTIASFRRTNFDAVAECFVGVLELAREIGVLKVGTVSTDGTKLRANASKHQNVTYGRAGELTAALQSEVRELLEQAERDDQEDRDDGQKLPDELARHEALKAKLEQARERLEQQAKQRAEAQRADYERKVDARAQRHGRRQGKIIRPPDPVPRPEEQINMVDADSRLMRKNKHSGYEQSYNAQTVVDADGSQLILAARVSQCASDANELVANVAAIAAVGRPAAVLADAGYACEAQVQALERQQVEVYVSTGAEDNHQRRRHDFRPPHRRRAGPKVLKAPWLLAMKAKLETEAGRKRYALRKQTVEPVFGIIKSVMGFRQFLLRGVTKVSGEWQLVGLAYNCKRLWNLKLALG